MVKTKGSLFNTLHRKLGQVLPEFHAIDLQTRKKAKFCGPGTRVAMRESRGDHLGLDPSKDTDYYCYIHDKAYENPDLTFRNQADRELAEGMKKIYQNPDAPWGQKLNAYLINKFMNIKSTVGFGRKKQTLEEQCAALAKRKRVVRQKKKPRKTDSIKEVLKKKDKLKKVNVSLKEFNKLKDMIRTHKIPDILLTKLFKLNQKIKSQLKEATKSAPIELKTQIREEQAIVREWEEYMVQQMGTDPPQSPDPESPDPDDWDPESPDPQDF